jgi:hypothetical protein
MNERSHSIASSFTSSLLLGLRHFLAPKGAEKLTMQAKEVNDPKTPETLINSRFRLI